MKPTGVFAPIFHELDFGHSWVFANCIGNGHGINEHNVISRKRCRVHQRGTESPSSVDIVQLACLSTSRTCIAYGHHSDSVFNSVLSSNIQIQIQISIQISIHYSYSTNPIQLFLFTVPIHYSYSTIPIHYSQNYSPIQDSGTQMFNNIHEQNLIYKNCNIKKIYKFSTNMIIKHIFDTFKHILQSFPLS